MECMSQLAMLAAIITVFLDKGQSQVDPQIRQQLVDITTTDMTTAIATYPPVSISFNSSIGSPKQGENVTLLCSVDSNPESNFTITNTTESNGDVVFSSSKVLTDIGCYKMQYECQAENNISRALGIPPINDSIIIDVKCRPHIYETNVENMTVYTSFGKTETIEIGLLANPFPNISRTDWQYTQQDTMKTALPTNVNLSTSSGNTIKLVIMEVTEGNLGSYTLRTSNSLGEMEYTFSVQLAPAVPGEPHLAIVPKTIFTGSESAVVLNCNVTDLGVPEATEYIWFKDGNNHTRQSGSVLILKPYTVAGDDGNYTCRAANTLGEGKVSNSAELIIKDAPENTPPLPSTRTAVITITTPIATCTFRSKPGCTIDWLYNSTTALPAGIILRPSEDFYDGKYTIRSSNLLWNLATSEASRIQSRGTYQCRASLDGTDQRLSGLMTLKPEYGPLHTTLDGTAELTVIEGSTVIRYCQASCNPACQYRWRKGVVTLSTNAKLELTPVTHQDIAEYICTVWNKHGGATLLFNLDVQYSPVSISFNPSIVSPVQGDTVTLTCSVISNPTSTLTITNKTESNGDAVVSSSKVLTDIGCYKMQYECQAENNISRALGKPPVKSLINIDVKCSPQIYYTNPENMMVQTSLGKTETIEIGLLANPFPNIQRENWQYTRQDTTDSMVLPENVILSTTEGNTIRLVIVEVIVENLGNYTLTTSNGIGVMQYTFSTQLVQEQKSNAGLIAGITVAVIVVLAGIIVGLLFYFRKIPLVIVMKNKQTNRRPMEFQEENVNMSSHTSEARDNPTQGGYETVMPSTKQEKPSVYTDLTYKPPPAAKPSKLRGKDKDSTNVVSNLRRSDIDLLEMVSSGKYYEIWTAKMKKMGRLTTSYIAKKLKDSQSRAYPHQTYLAEQADILKKLNSTQFIKCYGLIQDSASDLPLYMIILESASGGSLHDYLTKQPLYHNVSQPHLTNFEFISQITSAVDNLNNQSFPVLHYCLSVHHVLLTDSKMCKLTGFSTPEAVRAREKYEQDHGHRRPLRWLAPEAIDCEHVVESDIWSLGVCIWQILSGGEKPHGNVPDNTPDPSQFRRFLRKPPNSNKEMYDILVNCWLHEPKRRISFADINASCQMPSIYENVTI